jgi:hypothetical protein
MIAEVMTSWTGTGAEGSAFSCNIAEEYQIKRWTDLTAQPVSSLKPEPNLYSIEIIVDDLVLEQIEGDLKYYVVWQEPLATYGALD